MVSHLHAAFGDGVSTWQEGAESGYANIIDGTSDSYSLIQSAKVSLGDNAFRLDVLASLDPVIVEDNWVELDRDVDVQVGTKLFFRDSLQYAYPAQVATVQVSTDDGSTWPHVIYSISGTGEVVEQSFGQREIELGSSFAGQQIRIRFHYEHTGGSLFVGNLVGWFIDDIQVGLAYVPPPKTEWTIGDPSADEVLYVELINRSRANALVEAQRLAALTNSDVLAAYSDHGIDTADIITQYQWHIANGFMANVAQPLAFNTKLLEMSQLHTNDMFDNGFQDHVSVNPASPFAPGYKLGDRINAIGYSGYAGENVFAYARSVEYAHAGFAVDWGEGINNPTYYNQQTGQHEYNPGYNAAFDDQGMQNPAGHRLNIHNPSFNEVGIGVVNGTNGQFGPQLVTQNLGNDPGLTYICGVVYEDINGDSFYSVQNHSNTEGRSDIRIDVDGSFFYTLSTSAGAYAIPVPGDGTYDVTFSGEGIATYTTSVTVTNGQNVKLDHNPEDLTGYALWEQQNALTLGANGDDDGDRLQNLIEYALAGMNPHGTTPDLAPMLTADPDGKRRFSIQKRAGANGIAYMVQVSTTLAPNSWQAAGVLAGTTVEVDDADELVVAIESSVERVFVRLQVVEQ